jgi:hypothetical protein
MTHPWCGIVLQLLPFTVVFTPAIYGDSPARAARADRASARKLAAFDASAQSAKSNGRECLVDPLHRAGHPECISGLAIPSNTHHYGGYYVGGGLPIRGEAPCSAHEGTWGWDYCGLLFPKRIALNWGHGLRQQGGTGAYKTDGPKLSKD